LITGTRYFNVEGMLPFENQVADYIKRTGNHVLYRVTPVYEGNNLVAGGVQMEAMSVEDKGKGVCFNVYVYNIQPDIVIDYSTGENWDLASAPKEINDYIINIKKGIFHYRSCANAETIGKNNRQYYTGNRSQMLAEGYKAAQCCRP